MRSPVKQDDATASASAAAFPFIRLEELAARLGKIRAGMREKGVAIAFFTSPESIYYLSGYQTRAVAANQCLVVPLEGEIVLVTRHIDRGNFLLIRDRTPVGRLVTYTDDQAHESMSVVASASKLPDAGAAVGFELDTLFFPSSQLEKLRAAVGGPKMVDVGDLVGEQRLIKSLWEIACHRRAGEIVVKTMKEGLAFARPGMLDSDLAAQVAASTIRRGSEWVATWPVILTGPQTGRAHSSWEGVAIRPGEATTLEFAAVVRRYHTPLFRTVIFSPTDEQRRWAEAIEKSHQAGLEAVRPGTTPDAIYKAEVDVLGKFGVAELVSGRVGYTVGIGFSPNWVQRNGVDLIKKDATRLEPGMVFHMVTMLMRPGELGMAHSSSIVVTDRGFEILTDDGLTGPVLS